MFDVEFKARLRSVAVYAQEVDDLIQRRIRLTLEREFDNLVAAGLGEAGPTVREHLRSMDLNKAEIPLDAIEAELTLKGASGPGVRIERATGMKATVKAGKPGQDSVVDEEPVVKLQFVTPFSEDIWVFLGRNVIGWVDVTLRRAQLSLPLGKPAAKPKPPADGPATGTVEEVAKSLQHLGPGGAPAKLVSVGNAPRATLKAPTRKRPKVDDDIAVHAATPEEAEEIRQARFSEADLDEDEEDDDKPAVPGARPEILAF